MLTHVMDLLYFSDQKRGVDVRKSDYPVTIHHILSHV